MKDIRGFHSYKGITILQHENIEHAIKKLLNEVKPAQVIEIGTASGGLSLMIRDLLDELNLKNTNFITYDVIDTSRPYFDLAIQNGAKIDLRIKNLFDNAYSNLTDNGLKEIESIITKPGKTIVFCDGGHKIAEFNCISKLIKQGDIIMAHDYAPTIEYFQDNIKNKVWNWQEIKDSDIQDAVDSYGLEPFMEKEFIDVVWVCKIKK